MFEEVSHHLYAVPHVSAGQTGLPTLYHPVQRKGRGGTSVKGRVENGTVPALSHVVDQNRGVGADFRTVALNQKLANQLVRSLTLPRSDGGFLSETSSGSYLRNRAVLYRFGLGYRSRNRRGDGLDTSPQRGDFGLITGG